MNQLKKQQDNMDLENVHVPQDLPLGDDELDQIDFDELSEIIDEANIDDSKKIILQAQISRLEEFNGPLPHPDILKKYDNYFPGMGREIFDMARREQDFNHQMIAADSKRRDSESDDQSKAVSTYLTLQKRMQIFMFSITPICFILCGLCIYLGKNLVSLAAFIGAFGSFFLNVYYGRTDTHTSDESDDDEKEQD